MTFAVGLQFVFRGATTVQNGGMKKYSSKLDISRSLIREFEINLEYTRARCEKYSSKLDISRSLIRIFADMKKSFVITAAVVLALLLVVGCGGRVKQNNKAVQVKAPRVFVPAIMPSSITDPEELRLYMCEHYWDKVNFADSTFFAEIDTTQMLNAFIAYVGNFMNPEDGEPMGRFMAKVAKYPHSLRYFAMLADQVLYDPNSPLRSDELYIPVLQALVDSEWLDKYEKLSPQYNLNLALQNRIGHKANDFRYTMASGRSGTLYGIKAKYTLIFFNNPGCSMCKTIREEISASQLLTDMINRGEIKVLALYPDEQLDEWHNYREHIPSNWINSYDKGTVIRNNNLYDLKAIPALYLLDSQKRVLVKDSTEVGYIEYVVAQRM